MDDNLPQVMSNLEIVCNAEISCSGASSSFQSMFIKNRDLSKNECLAPLAQDADYCTDTYLGHSWTVRCV